MNNDSDRLRAFRSGAEYYEALFDGAARLEREGPYLRAVFERAPGRRVVDLACGTGPHALFFAELGAEVTALDLSPEMIAHASKRRPHKRVHYEVGDLRAPQGGPWDLAVCLGNSMCLLPSPAEVAAAFAALYSRLSPGGLLLIQVLNYAAAAAQEPVHRVVRKTVGEHEIVAVKSLVPQAGRTLLSLTFYAFHGNEHVSVAESAVLLHLGREDLEAFAGRAGFRPAEAYGAFDRQPFRPESSSDLIMLLQKEYT